MRGDAGHAQLARGEGRLAQVSAGSRALGAGASKQELAVVAAGAGQEGRCVQLGVPP